MDILLRKIFGWGAALVSLFCLLICFIGFGDMVSGTSNYSVATDIGMLIFFFIITLGSGWFAWNNIRAKPASESDEAKIRRILSIARQNQGQISALQASLDANLDLDEAERLLERLVDKGIATMDVTEHASVLFVFPDFKATAELRQLND